jgi:hypothetical protein
MARRRPCETSALCRLYGLSQRIRSVNSDSELVAIEEEIDNVLKAERLKAEEGDENAVDAATLNVVAHRLENLIHDRREMLLKKPQIVSVA